MGAAELHEWINGLTWLLKQMPMSEVSSAWKEDSTRVAGRSILRQFCLLYLINGLRGKSNTKVNVLIGEKLGQREEGLLL